MKIGIIKEGKNPPDNRTPLTPLHCKQIMDNHPQVKIVVESSGNRCFSDEEYVQSGIKLQEDLSDCNILLGVKEVPVQQLIADKTYFFFSHTIKKQAYNRQLLIAILEKNIRLIDYEVLTNEKGERLIAFGFYAGMVGAHNAIYTYAHRTKEFSLPRLIECHDYEAARKVYHELKLTNFKVILTGKGRVGSGAAKVLQDMGIKRVSPKEFLEGQFNFPVFAQIDSEDYVKHKGGKSYRKEEFYNHPENYAMDFEKYYEIADIFINGIYYDSKAPAFFTVDEMKQSNFKTKVIADVTCDIAPVSSIPSTLFASTIQDPIFGFDPTTNSAVEPHQDNIIDMMTIDNLPNELPRDSSVAFADQFIQYVIPEILKAEKSEILAKATIAQDGKLTERYSYLESFVKSPA